MSADLTRRVAALERFAASLEDVLAGVIADERGDRRKELAEELDAAVGVFGELERRIAAVERAMKAQEGLLGLLERLEAKLDRWVGADPALRQ